jgi:hypothetical protein
MTPVRILLSAVILAACAHAAIEVHAVSGRADMVTGGSALIETTAPTDKFSASVNGHDVTQSFHASQSGAMLGRVEGLNVGKNELEIKSSKGSAKLELVNYPITGPVFSGPHQKPFVCQTDQAGLGAPLDADCSFRTVVTYAYKSTQPPVARGRGATPDPTALPAGFKAYDPAAPRPADLAKAKTISGASVD